MDNQSEIFIKISENRLNIIAVIIAMVRDFDVAEDIYQDTVVEIIKTHQKLDSIDNFIPWAKGIARNLVYQYWKTKNRNKFITNTETLDYFADMVNEDSEDIWKNERAGLRKCFKKLPENKQKLFTLRYDDNLKGHALAQKASINYSSLRTTLARIRSLLRDCIDKFIQVPEI